jgi:hypothetical protein
MNTHAAVDRLSSFARPLPWDLADLVPYFLLGAVLPPTLYMSFAGVPAFLESLHAKPEVWGVLVAGFAYPLGLIAYSIGKLLRELFIKVGGDKLPDFLSQELADEISDAIEKLVFQKNRNGERDFGSYLAATSLMAPAYLPNSAANLHRQESFYRVFTIMLAVLTLTFLCLSASSLLHLFNVLGGGWGFFAGAAVVVGALIFTLERSAREQNYLVVAMQVELAAALMAVLNERRKDQKTTRK